MESIVKKILSRDVYRIVFFGDSITASYFESFENIHGTCEPEYGFPERLRRLLQTVFPDTRIEILPAGVGGETAADAVRRLSKDVLAHCPDLVIVNFMLNDARLLNADEYREALKTIFGTVKASGSECVYLTESMGCTAVTSPVRPDIGEEMAQCQNSGKVDGFHEISKQTALECGVKVCDVYALWKEMSRLGIDTNRLLTNRINHPFREMHTLFAYELFRTMILEK